MAPPNDDFQWWHGFLTERQNSSRRWLRLPNERFLWRKVEWPLRALWLNASDCLRRRERSTPKDLLADSYHLE